MAWYQDGEWEGLRVDRAGHLLAQMMYSVNEREDFLGRTLSTWGRLGKSYPMAYDLDGETREAADDYLEMLQAAIPELYNSTRLKFFVEPDGTHWTEASLFSAAGSVDHWLSLGRPSGLKPYLQLKNVLEQLRCIRLYMFPLDLTTELATQDIGGGVYSNIFYASSRQGAWSAALAAVGPLRGAFSHWSVGVGDGYFPFAPYGALLYTKMRIIYYGHYGEYGTSEELGIPGEVRNLKITLFTSVSGFTPVVTIGGQQVTLQSGTNFEVTLAGPFRFTRVPPRSDPFDPATIYWGIDLPFEYQPPATVPSSANFGASCQVTGGAEATVELVPSTDLTYG